MIEDRPATASTAPPLPEPERAAMAAGKNRRDSAFRAANRWLGRINIWAATALLVLVAAILALSFAFVLVEAGLYGTKAEVLWGASIITLLVGVPIIYHAQHIIRQLSASRRNLKLMTERLAWALHNAERANEEKSRFLATMSHELRTPLNAVIGFSDIMMNERLGTMANPRYRSYAEDINGSGMHLLGIINEILDLAKIESGGMQVDETASCDPVAAIEAAATIVRPLAARQRVALDVTLPEQRLRLAAVERMMRQILINILSNALKFTAPGGTVTLAAALRPNGNLVVTITDTGVGMSAEEVKVALTPFGQVRNKMSGQHAGTGLGLPLAKAMLELHGGRLMIRSAPGRGTTMVLVLPAAHVTVLPSDAAAEAATPAEGTAPADGAGDAWDAAATGGGPAA